MRIKRNTHRNEWTCIENAFMAAKAMGAEGVLVIPFKDGDPHSALWNPGPSKKNKRGMEVFMKTWGLLN